MDPRLKGYKIIAIIAVAYGLFSCTQPANSVSSDPQVLAKLDALEEKIDTLMANLEAVQVAVAAEPDGTRPCTVDEVVNQSLGGCDPTLLPDGVAVSTTYCIAQGRQGSLGANYALSGAWELALGAAWTNGPNAELKLNVAAPPVIPVGTVIIGPGGVPVPLAAPIPFPNEIAAGGEMSLGRNLNICVDIPLRRLAAPEIEQVHALVRGVNVSDGKYARRTGRVLNYAARRTPIAEANTLADLSSRIPFEAGPDSFEDAELAFKKLINGEFTSVATSGMQVFESPAFQQLVGAVDLPQPVLDTINDPERIFSALKTIGAANIGQACTRLGISDELRDRFPAVDTQCGRFEAYPDVAAILGNLPAMQDRLSHMYTKSGLRTFICNALANIPGFACPAP